MNGIPLKIEQDGPVRIAHMTDDLEISVAPVVRQELLTSLTNDDMGMVVDLSETNYVDSAGVNLLFELAEKLRARQLRLAVVYPEGDLIERVMSLVNIDAVAAVHRTRDDAVRDVAGKP